MIPSLGIVMDPIESINTKKDSSFAMLLEAQSRDWPIHYIQMNGLYLNDGTAYASGHRLRVMDNGDNWFELEDKFDIPAGNLDVILMRKDPPFDTEYLYATQILEIAQNQGALVVNNPQALRDANEKLAATWFPQCCPPTLVSRNAHQLREFLQTHNEIILKPLDAMGGASIFKLAVDDPNTSVIIETLTDLGSRFTMAQRYIPEISAGDKRILLIDGEPVEWALARIPADGETRGNLAAGGRGEGIELSERDRWICNQVAAEIKKSGLLFVGLDVIGDFLTEVNVTSPTCIRELDSQYGINISARLFDAIEKRLAR